MTNSKMIRLHAVFLAKLFSIILAASILSTGCATKKTTIPLKEKHAEITIVHSWGDSFDKELQKILIAPFEASHPNIKVSVKQIDSIGWELPSEASLKSFTGSEAPDLVLLDRAIVSNYAFKGALSDLSGYVKSARISPADYYPIAWKECLYNGRSFCMPWDIDTRQMIYNKTILAASGFNPDKPPTTIAELDQMSEKIAKRGTNGLYTQVGFIPWAMVDGDLFTHGLNFGGKWEQNGSFTPNDPNIAKALEWVVSQYGKYDQVQINNFMDSKTTSFKQGSVAFVFASPWFFTNFLHSPEPKFEWGIAPMPTFDGIKPVTLAGGSSIVMPKGTKHPDEAWELLKYITHKEGSLIWTKEINRNGEVVLSAMPQTNDELKLSEKPYLAPFLAAIPTAVSSPQIVTTMNIWKEEESVVHKAISKEKAPQQLLDEWKSKVNAAQMQSR